MQPRSRTQKNKDASEVANDSFQLSSALELAWNAVALAVAQPLKVQIHYSKAARTAASMNPW
jgi:hypothetical protein